MSTVYLIKNTPEAIDKYIQWIRLRDHAKSLLREECTKSYMKDVDNPNEKFADFQETLEARFNELEKAERILNGRVLMQ